MTSDVDVLKFTDFFEKMKKCIQRDWEKNSVYSLSVFLDHVLAGWDREWNPKFLVDVARQSMLLYIRITKMKKQAKLLYIKADNEDDKEFLINEALEEFEKKKD